ncbi:hypothetical protein [Pseudomonas soli]|uniref:hypothetical protein n=1 Tax=Pseudomonas soli TaxID=1306993 RepID=UPI003DA9772F
MLSAPQASAIVLDHLADVIRMDGRPERFVVQSCERSAKGDYWVVRCNSEDCVVHGKTEYCYVGVNAYLVNAISGAFETVANCFTIEEYLHDKDDLEAAAGKTYVLAPSFSGDSKTAVIKLRQKLAYSYPHTLFLLAGAGRLWLKGIRRQLEHAQQILAIEGIATQIELHADPLDAVLIGPETWYIDAVFNALRRKPLHPGEPAE